MKHTRPEAFLTGGLLRAVRDGRLTEAEFVARFGSQGYHVLRKHAVIVLDGERVRLSRRHLFPDGSRFVWGNAVVHLDGDLVQQVRWGRSGPPVFAENP